MRVTAVAYCGGTFQVTLKLAVPVIGLPAVSLAAEYRPRRFATAQVWLSSAVFPLEAVTVQPDTRPSVPIVTLMLVRP